MKTVGILAAGTPPETLEQQYGSYAEMTMRLFEEVERSFAYKTYDVREDHFPDSAADCDGWLITGSKFNVDDDLAWIDRLRQLIVEIDERGSPLIGICFGHQLIADVLGGQVESFAGGWGVGAHQYEVMADHPLNGQLPDELSVHAMHRYQVTEKPKRAELMMQSDFCRYAGLTYGNRILTLQPHPEFKKPFEEALIRSRRGDAIPTSCADRALDSLQAEGVATHSQMIARIMADLLDT